MGADALAFDHWRVGAIAGYSRTDFDVKERLSSGLSDNYHAGLYGGATWGALSFRSGAATFTTLGLREPTRFDLKGATATVKGSLGWRHALGDQTRFPPCGSPAVARPSRSQA